MSAMAQPAGGEQRPVTEYYVAVDGSDANAGNKDKPFATVRGARDVARASSAANAGRDVVVYIRGGTYTLDRPIEFSPDDSAPEGRTITYVAFPGETPFFSGGRAIRGWKKTPTHWEVEIADVRDGKWRFDQLFVAGERRPRARGPNVGYHRVAAAGPDNRTSFQFEPGDVPRIADLGGAEILFLHDWSVSRVSIKSVDHKRNVLTLAHPIGAGADFFRITGFEPHPRYRIENAIELLDAPGEWHLDSRGVLRYMPLPGENIETFEAIAPAAESLLVVRGDARGSKPVQNLRFVGLTFAHAAATQFPGGYAGVQAGFHEVRQPSADVPKRGRMSAAVVFDSTVNCRFEHGRIVHVGASAIAIEGPSQGNAVVGNEIADVGGNGVMVGEPSSDPALIAKGNEVSNNRIHHCGATFHGCVGVWVGITDSTIVSHNEIRDLPYSGVSVGWVWNPTPSPCRANRIEFNHIHHVMQILSDGGGIYTLGRQEGSVLRGNLIHDVPLNAGRAESNGMFIDEGSSEIAIERNVIYATDRSPIRFHRAQRNAIRDNVLVLPKDMPAFRYNNTDESTMTFERNATPAADSWNPPQPAEIGAGILETNRK